MKLDPSFLRYLTKDDFRVLTAVEIGQKNHEIVPSALCASISNLRHGGVEKLLQNLLRHKLLHHESKYFDGYRLTNLGYDYLALRTFLSRDLVTGVGRQIGVGKESDIFLVTNDEEEELCLKLHRLGRTSFRAIKNKRDYHKGRKSPSWLYLSRLAAVKEFEFMKALREHGFPVPKPVDANRHCVLMGLVDGFPLNQVKNLDDKETIYIKLMDILVRFAHHGLIHGDYNEFNIMIDKVGNITVIDFPQMVSISHPNARMYFDRDVNCIRRFFRKRFNFIMDYIPSFEDVIQGQHAHLDKLLQASGFTKQMSKTLDSFILTSKSDDSDDDSNDTDSNDDDEPDIENEENEIQIEHSSEEIDGGNDESFDVVVARTSTLSIQASMNNGVKDMEYAATNNTKDVPMIQSEIISKADENITHISGEESDNDAETTYADDGPDAYLKYDYAAVDNNVAGADTSANEWVRRRVRREIGRKSKGHKKAIKSSRNVVKNRERRRVIQSMGEF